MEETNYLYENGLPWKDFPAGAMMKNLKDWKRRIKNNSYASIIIASPQGRGKTTLAVEILEAYQGKPIDYNGQIAFGFQDFKSKLEYCNSKNYSVMIFDEAGEISSRDAMTRSNKDFLRILDLYRAYKIFLIICLQRVSMLDSAIMETEVIRSVCYISERKKRYAVANFYSLADMFGILGKMFFIRKHKNMPPNIAFNEAFPMLKLKFKPLPFEQQAELDHIGMKHKKMILSNTSSGDYNANKERDERIKFVAQYIRAGNGGK